MLILVPGKIVLSVHVTPVHISGQVIITIDFPRSRSCDHLTILKGGLLNSASANFGQEIVLLGSGSTRGRVVKMKRLRESIDFIIIVGVSLFLISGNVLNALSPGVNGGSP